MIFWYFFCWSLLVAWICCFFCGWFVCVFFCVFVIFVELSLFFIDVRSVDLFGVCWGFLIDAS